MPTDTIRGHNDFNVLRGLESVQLVKEFQHRTLHLGITSTTAAFTTRTSNGIDFVHEDDTRRVFSSHHEELAHHSASLSDVFLNQFASTDTDKLAVGVVCYGTRQQRLSCPRGTVQQDTLGLGDTEGLEQFGVLYGKFDDFLDLFDLLVETSDHLVRAVRDFLDHHERNKRVDFVRQDFVKGIRIGTEGNAQRGFQSVDVDFGVDINNCRGGNIRKCFNSIQILDVLYLPSGWTLTKTLVFPMTLTTSPT